MRVAILSDTHIPSRERTLPDWVGTEIEQADHTIHAGDFDSPDAFDSIEAVADSLTAVKGNMDQRLDLPAVETVDLGGIRFVVMHGTGSLDEYETRVATTVAAHADGPTVGVCGHTHQLMDTTVDDVRLLNPGSATGASPASKPSMLVADVEDGELTVTVREG
ncbi:metallophosphoesterase family protein [Halocatena pleomorpha]|uniref:Phosphoesterase n=1 Tax=Halocatena pleomorpha TaxID=1785090 RepID=A0A3P3R6M4_9EURY|nr:metallophosphoesterase family protein [Halocatena pleomorpha]RRJ28638.1 metallophosphoesterase [Halocatena pleomorpha]